MSEPIQAAVAALAVTKRFGPRPQLDRILANRGYRRALLAVLLPGLDGVPWTIVDAGDGAFVMTLLFDQSDSLLVSLRRQTENG